MSILTFFSKEIEHFASKMRFKRDFILMQRRSMEEAKKEVKEEIHKEEEEKQEEEAEQKADELEGFAEEAPTVKRQKKFDKFLQYFDKYSKDFSAQADKTVQEMDRPVVIPDVDVHRYDSEEEKKARLPWYKRWFS